METPPLQRVYTYSVRAFEGALGPRIARAVQRACNGWRKTKLVGMAEMPVELKLRVDLEFIVWPADGSIQIATDHGVIDLGGIRYTTKHWWLRFTRKPYLTDLLFWAIGRVLVGDFQPLAIKPADVTKQFLLSTYDTENTLRCMIDHNQSLQQS